MYDIKAPYTATSVTVNSNSLGGLDNNALKKLIPNLIRDIIENKKRNVNIGVTNDIFYFSSLLWFKMSVLKVCISALIS